MPRQKKDVWYSFKEIIVGGVKRAKCKTCGFEVVNNAARMEKHMRDCRNVDDDDDIQEQSTSSATTTSSAPPAPKKRQTALNVISTNPTRQHESDILVTRYFIATNTPFNAASNKHLAKLVQFLRPGTTVPDRRRIGGELLDEIYASEQTKVKRMVSGSNVTLAIDGWSTLTNEPVLGVSFYHCGKCYLVNTMSTIGESHTTEYLVQVTREQMEHVRKEFEVNVTSVVTDNAANMNAMRRELALVHTYGCHSHIANLLSKDILCQKDIKPIMTKIITVLKWVRNTHACSADLVENNMTRPPLPCETRWNSNIDTIEYFQKNWLMLAEIANKHLKNTDMVFRHMEEVSLKRSAEDILQFMKSVGVTLDNLQKNSCTLSETFKLWKNVAGQAPIQYASAVAKRVQQAILPVVLAANLLDHKYAGEDQNPDETRQAIDYIRETAGENIMPELTNYMAKVPPYNEYLFAEGYKKVESEAWWRSGLRLGFSKELVDYASTLANAISSSAGLERCFSTLGLTYGKLRSSLGVEKAGKLAFLFKQLNE